MSPGRSIAQAQQAVHGLDHSADELGRWGSRATGGGALLGWRIGLWVHGHPAPSSLSPSGRWAKPFSRSKTTPQDFHVDENTVVKVPMMFQDKNRHWYFHDRYVPCSVLRMDYMGNARAFFILPNKGKMKQVEEVLTPEMLTRWSNMLQKR